MQLIYEGKDISNYVNICSAGITDNSGGVADSVDICFSDTDKLWGKWKPQKNDTIKLIQDGFSSGMMYVDELEENRSMFVIRAISIPQEAKSTKTKSWENIRFLELSKKIAMLYGFELQTFGVANNLYTRLDQLEKADFEFLAYRCILEGNVLKISDKKVIIYNEAFLESASPARTISPDSLVGDYEIKQQSLGIYNSCRLTYGDINYTYTPSKAPYGPTLKIDSVYAENMAEAERYCKNSLRSKNKYEWWGQLPIALDTKIAGGNTIKIKNFGFADGMWFIEQVTHSLVSKKSIIQCRKVLAGY